MVSDSKPDIDPLLSKMNTKSKTSESFLGSTIDLLLDTLEKSNKKAVDITVQNDVLDKLIS